MAAENVIARVEAKLDAQTARIDAQTRKLNLMLWLVGTGVAVIIAVGGVLVSTLLN